MEPVTVTLQITDDLQETIEIHEGENIEQLASDFCHKYGINGAFTQSIVDEFKRNIVEHFGTDGLQRYVLSSRRPSEERVSRGHSDAYRSSRTGAKHDLNHQFDNAPFERKNSKEVKEGKASKEQIITIKKNGKDKSVENKAKVTKDPESPGAKLRKYLRNIDQQKRTSQPQIDRPEIATVKKSAQTSPEVPSSNDVPNKKNRPTPNHLPKPLSLNDPLAFRDSSTPPLSPQNNPFTQLLNRQEEDHSVIIPMNKTDNQSDIQSIMNMERDLQEEDGELKDIFENSAYFRATKKAARQELQPGSRTNREGFKNKEDPLSHSFSNPSPSRTRQLSKQKTTGYAVNPETGKIETAAESKSRAEQKGPYHPAVVMRSSQPLSQRASSKPFTIPLPEPEEDDEIPNGPPIKQNTHGNPPLQHTQTFPQQIHKKGFQAHRHEFDDDFRITDPTHEKMKKTYEDNFKKNKKIQEPLQPKQLSKKNTQKEEREAQLIDRLESELQAIEDKQDQEKKSSVLTFFHSDAKDQSSRTPTPKKGDKIKKLSLADSIPPEQSHGLPGKVEEQTKTHPKQLSPSKDENLASSVVYKHVKGYPVHSSTRALQKSISPHPRNRATATAVDNLKGGEVTQTFDGRKTLLPVGTHHFQRLVSKSRSKSPMKTGFISHRDLNHHSHKLHHDHIPRPMEASPRSKSRRKSRFVTPIDKTTYEKLQKKSLVYEGKLTSHEERELKEVRSKPSINPKSREISAMLNRGNYDTVHEKLFYRGIEGFKRKEELGEIEFGLTHPFRPNAGGDRTPKLVVKRDEVDKLVYSYKEKELQISRRKHEVNNFDPQDGSKLFTPRINKSSGVRHKYTLKEINDWHEEKREFLLGVRQVFDFLDHNGTGYVSAARIDYENIHPELLRVLGDILTLVETVQIDLNFGQFYELIVENDLSHELSEIFSMISEQPLINPKKLKEHNFKFN